MNKLLVFIVTTLPIFISGQDINNEINDSLHLEEFVIAVSRVSEQSPITFANVNAADIEEIYVGQDPVLLLQTFTPSIISYSDGGTDIGNYSQFRLRGMDQDRINISLDGIPLNDMVDHGTYFSNFSDFGNSVESIQIIRGVGINSSGIASYGGAINFESPNLFESDFKGGVQLTGGSFGTLRTAAEVNTGLMESGVGIYTRMSKTSTDGYKYNSGSDSYSLFFSGGYLGDKEMLKLTAFSGRTQNGQSYEHVPESQILLDPRTNFNNLNDIDDFEQSRVHLTYVNQLNSDLSFSGSVYYNGAGGVFPYTFDGVQYMYGLENDHYGVQAFISKEMNSSRLDFGINTYLFDRVNFEYISPFVTEPYARDFTDKNEISVFGKYQNKLNQFNLFTNVEMRNISMSITGDESIAVPFSINGDYTFINGIVGLSYDISSNNNFYMSYGISNREPTRSDIFNGVGQHETVKDLELGFRKRTEKINLNVNIFHLDFDNEITKIGALQNQSYVEIRQNVANSTRTGVELSLNYMLNELFEFGFIGSAMSSNISDYNNGMASYFDVEHVLTPNLIIQPSFLFNLSDKMTFSSTGMYVSNSFTELSNNPDFGLSSFFVLNGQLNYTVNSQVSAQLVINNIFDNLYYTEGSPIDENFDGAFEEVGLRIQPPRNFYFMINYSF